MVFQQPNGHRFDVVDSGPIHEWIESVNPDEWKHGSGAAAIETTEHQLGLMFRQGIGLILTYTSLDLEEMYFSQSANASTTPVSVFVGGDYFNFAKSLFVEMEIGLKAIDEFVTSPQTRPAVVDWIRSMDRPSLSDDLLHGEEY